MALTEDEKRMARAYNIGYLLNSYDPRLMDKIIKGNPNNEFVKAMQVGRDHQEFNVNIPRKDYSKEFKNGFFSGRTLAQHDPKTVENMLATKGLNKDYKKGLEAAKKEHEILSIQEKLRREPKTPEKELRNDPNFKKGYNVGYRLAESYGFALGTLERSNEKYSKYVEGIQAGRKQYDFDLSKLTEKEPDARLFPDDPIRSRYEQELLDNKYRELDNLTESQGKILSRKEDFFDAPIPKWMEKKDHGKGKSAPRQDKQKDNDIDIDR